MRRFVIGVACGAGFTACAGDDGSADGSGSTSRPTDTGTTLTDGTSNGVDSSASGQPTGRDTSTGPADGTATTDDTIFDVGTMPDAGVDAPSCTVQRDGAGVGTCRQTAPPDAFEPDVQWEWNGGGGPLTQAVSTPLVANLTDDDGNGTIDLCDTPDVVVVAFSDFTLIGQIVVLSGDDGTEHFTIAEPVSATVTPALGDIDHDGIPEIVTTTNTGQVVAFEHTGALKWMSPTPAGIVDFAGPALADLDGDGNVEIMVGGGVYDEAGISLWNNGTDGGNGVGSLVTSADLDGDGDQEVIHGAVAFHHDGSPYYDTGLQPGVPHVANLDAEPGPEILVMNADGMNLIDADGTVLWSGLTPTGDPTSIWTTWYKPGTVHDFDGDGVAEFATSSGNTYATYEVSALMPTIIWQSPVLDLSGSAGGTAFDFDGDSLAEAMYADETQLFVYDPNGNPLLTAPRQSGTGLEYPVVADIDNDGSAEIVVVSNFQTIGGSPAVQAIRDIEDRWIQSRRIWNQHTYHVSNVREDGTIPTVETPSWTQLNTFRTNAQIEGGGICRPAG
ncbi:MAG: FG-GAP-like repeat-containing protein [Deltaproteobacteria bacterium]|nr:FG-GAP-like repeat-containing protein [Deltaproteobacteria bacterium]